MWRNPGAPLLENLLLVGFWLGFFATVSSHIEAPSEKCWEKLPRSSANQGVLMPCQFTGI